MGYIHCCGGLRKTRTFRIVPRGKFVVCEVDYLAKCPVCGHASTQLTRIDKDNNVSTIKKVKDKADLFFKKLKRFFLYEEVPFKSKDFFSRKFYLNYNEFGVKKRCYSNLSTVKIGLFENSKYKLKSNSYPIKTV